MRLDLLATEPHFLAHLLPLAAAGGAAVVIPEPVNAAQGLEHYRTLAAALGAGVDVSFALRPDADAVVVASYSDHKLARRLGARRIVVMEHGAGQSYGNGSGSYPGGRDRGDAVLFLTPNEYSARRWRQTYPDVPVEAIGSPRLERLPGRGPGPTTIAVGFHWDCPVGRPWSGTAFREYRARLRDLARRWQVIGHAHPRAIDTLQRDYRSLGIELVRTFDEVCRRADLYVADNTSTLFEFAATGRPVVVLNAAAWVARRPEGPGLRFWDAAGVGINVDRPADLLAVVEQALEDPGDVAMAREAALDIVYAHRAGATDRALGAIASVVVGRVAA